jgi:dolichol-phosphate mannosyltransferase
MMMGTPIRDMTSGYRAFTAAAAQRLRPDTCTAEGYTFQVEMAWRAHRLGMVVAEVPITFTERRDGESKLDGGIVREAMKLVTVWGIGRLLRREPPPIEPPSFPPGGGSPRGRKPDGDGGEHTT